ncbi:hypothetical protein [Methylobacterium oxalidis]|uniref:DUF2188 domain-containing protein n=1 Tax=Methylobacterium oxalidis TaxID=944322 RepID=A0A512JAP5_9HYPH|nr:hypothetical protein [Methylobacterium oxalidis]GEP07034.1 hypothetical protein MOX02_50720 [Methylobacterium oxalidis]GLS64614.1 hypothetical protein GCM10007888_29950 [Methylobacterium oxalidis]
MIEWNRYAVVHWKVSVLSEKNDAQLKGNTRAFAELAQAVTFVKALNDEHQQTARVDCGGKSFRIDEINYLAEHADFPREPRPAAA